MAASTTLLQFLLMVIAGWLHRQQAALIDYLNDENRLLHQRLGGRRIIFTDAERRILAEKAKAVGRKTLRELGTIVTPETLLRWHRELVSRKWTFLERRRPGDRAAAPSWRRWSAWHVRTALQNELQSENEQRFAG